MLMPAAVVIVLLLGAVAVDSAIVFLAQREAHAIAFDAANDAAGAGLDVDAARSSGVLVHDPDRVVEVATAGVAAAGRDDVRLVSVSIDGDDVVVTVEVTVEHLFVQVLDRPGHDTHRVTARVAAQVVGP